MRTGFSNQLVSEMFVTLSDLTTPISAIFRLVSGKKRFRMGE